MVDMLDVKLSDGKRPPKVWWARVRHESVDGLHILTSDDIEGLLLASRKPEELLRQIVPTIEALIKHNHGLECSVVLGEEFSRFEKPASRASLKDTIVVIQQKAA